MKHEESEVLDTALQEQNIQLSLEDLALLGQHLDYVLEINKSLRLTAIEDKESGERLHILDSLLVIPELQDAPEGPMLDIGTGGGYPGFPLAIATKKSVDLLDSVQKKAKAVDNFLTRYYTGSLSIQTLGVRAEELATERPGHYAVVLARAVSSLPALVELASPLLMTGGQLIAHKGPHDEDELQRALTVADMTGMVFKSKREYILPGGDEHRSVYVFNKSRESDINLPRRPGRAQRKPLA
ncbi:MAG: 16S rRNA (guanine(527)-N(7))-methyltransferase RsmG [Coriobacteriia bacterium]|nr:16S rRNA (guanine(527)-N(7))-methyltransferase RsmG [Coriobacteriia bacterium]